MYLGEKRVVNNEIVDILIRKNIDYKEDNQYKSIYALMTTGELIPITCGKESYKYLCLGCFKIIIERWPMKGENLKFKLGLKQKYDNSKISKMSFHWNPYISERIKKVLMIPIVIISLCFPLFGELNKTYPTSPVTTLRLETYVDAIETIHNSTYTIQTSTWISLIDHPKVYVKLNDPIYGYVLIGTGTVVASSWTASQFFDMAVKTAKYKLIEEVLDNDVEQYMVWPSTDCPFGWKGWGNKVINGNNVPSVCGK